MASGSQTPMWMGFVECCVYRNENVVEQATVTFDGDTWERVEHERAPLLSETGEDGVSDAEAVRFVHWEDEYDTIVVEVVASASEGPSFIVEARHRLKGWSSSWRLSDGAAAREGAERFVREYSNAGSELTPRERWNAAGSAVL